MEDLNTSEVELDKQIETYKAQLKVVKESVTEERNEEVDQLLSDLKQLIELTEENLMEVKKQKLLFMFHPTLEQTSSVSGEGAKHEYVSVPSTQEVQEEAKKGVKEEEEEEEEEDDLVGIRCSAPLKESWEAEDRYHNAVILCRELIASSDTVSAATPSLTRGTDSSATSDLTPSSSMSQTGGVVSGVRVLFSQPLYAAMRPCPYFMDGSCRYSAEECKFSHGHQVPFSSLRPVQEPDYELMHIGGKCLARNCEDQLWYSAIISRVGEECEVYFPTLSRAMQVAMEYVSPLESSGESSSEDDGDEEEEESGVVVEWKARDSCAGFGQWEQHTKGIGSKLLSKMGYVPGQGLGCQSQGRLEPVEIVILPAGKSLDVCAALRETEKVRKMEDSQDVVKRRRKGRRRKGRRRNGRHKEQPQDREEPATNMFDFLNTKILNQGKKSGVVIADTSTVSSTSSSSSSNLNVKLFKLEEDRKSVEKRKHSLQQALLRHQSRKDKALEGQVREKLAGVEERLKELCRQERMLQSSLKTKAQQKKLTIF